MCERRHQAFLDFPGRTKQFLRIIRKGLGLVVRAETLLALSLPEASVFSLTFLHPAPSNSSLLEAHGLRASPIQFQGRSFSTVSFYPRLYFRALPYPLLCLFFVLVYRCRRFPSRRFLLVAQAQRSLCVYSDSASESSQNRFLLRLSTVYRLRWHCFNYLLPFLYFLSSSFNQ